MPLELNLLYREPKSVISFFTIAFLSANDRHLLRLHWIEKVTGLTETNKTNVEYSSNWAGAILIGSGYTSVTGTFTAPTPTTDGSSSAWVGIDGDTFDTAILQTGIDWTLNGMCASSDAWKKSLAPFKGGSVTYDPWYEWYPGYAYDFSGIDISAGDSITVTVTVPSLTAGTAVIENNSSGQKVSHSFSNEGSEGSLCETNAEWIIEDFEEGGSQVQFADFGTVTFTGASATSGGITVGVSGATIIDIQHNGEILTDCSTSGSSGVTFTYV